MIKSASSYERKELEEGFRAQREEIYKLKQAYAALQFRTQQNQLDTALAAGLRSTLHSLCRRIINRKGATPLAKAWLEGE